MFYVLEMVSWGLGRQTGSVILHINTSHDYSDKHMSCDYTNKCISCGGHDYLRELCARCIACLCSSVLLCIGDTDMLMGLTRMFCIFMYSDVWQFEQTPAV